MRIGIDLGGTKIEGIVIDSDGTERARHRIATPSSDYEATLRGIARVVNELVEQAGPCNSIGIGIPGALSPATGVIKNANSTCLIGHALDKDLATLVNCPVRLANDANCFVVSEASDGAAKGFNVVFGIILGTGVGGGVVFNDKRVHPGLNAIAGEWGHNPLPWPTPQELSGPDCYCGKRGCIETFLSGKGLSLTYQSCGGDLSSDNPTIARRAEKGDPIASEALSLYEIRLAKSLATVINIVDPDVIVLGGGLSNISRLYSNVPNHFGDWVFSDRVDTVLAKNKHGDSSGVRGAAWLWPA